MIDPLGLSAEMEEDIKEATKDYDEAKDEINNKIHDRFKDIENKRHPMGDRQIWDLNKRKNALTAGYQLIVDQIRNGAKYKIKGRDADFIRIANDVYPNGKGVPGWTRFNANQLRGIGLDVADFSDKKSGFAAGLYQNDETGDYALSFRGTDTESFTDNHKDMRNNDRQNAGWQSDQYDLAKKLANTVLKSRDVRLKGITMTGHSLGGGLASAASLETGKKAITINAAGLHPNTVKEGEFSLNHFGKKLIKVYYIKGELLHQVNQEIPVISAAMRNAVGVQIPVATPLGVSSMLDLHSAQLKVLEDKK